MSDVFFDDFEILEEEVIPPPSREVEIPASYPETFDAITVWKFLENQGVPLEKVDTDDGRIFYITPPSPELETALGKLETFLANREATRTQERQTLVLLEGYINKLESGTLGIKESQKILSYLLKRELERART